MSRVKRATLVRWAGLVLSIVLGAVACGKPAATSAPQDPGADEGTSMRIQIELPKQRFVAGESMNATVKIVNDGSGPIDVPDPQINENWQPTYTVQGPAYEKGYTFSFRSAVFQDPRANPQGVTPVTVALQPRQVHAAHVPIEQLVELLEPGAYTITAELSWGGRSARSAPVPFTIERPRVRSCQSVAAPGIQDPYQIPVFCLQMGDAGDAQVQVATFSQDPQADLVKRTSVDHFAIPGQGATEIFSPWKNYTGIGTPSPRAGWRAGATLGVVDFGERGGMQITLPWTPRLVRPALTPLSAEVDLFVLGNAGSELALVRFPPPALGGSPRTLWTARLPGQALAGRAALSPRGAGDRRHALLVTEPDDGVTLILVDAATGGGTPSLHPVKIEGLHAIAVSEPALAIDDQGRAHGAVVLAREAAPGAPGRISVVDVVWPADRVAAATVDAREVAALSAAPRASAVAYSVSPGALRREWVLLLSGSRVMSSQAPGEQSELRGEPAVPLDLLVMEEHSYLLTFSKAGTLEMERL